MSLELIIGRAGTGKTFSCLEQIKKILETSPLDTKIFFILPAYQTYRAELELVEMTGGSVNTEMCSIHRFAKKILLEVGGATVPRISEIGRRLLLRKILSTHSKKDDLKFYKKSAKQRGFAENLADELKELRSYSIDSKSLLEILEKIKDTELADKIYDLAILSEDFRNSIEGKQNDESDLLEKAAELIKFSDDAKTSEIFVDGFIFFDLQQRKILKEILKYAKNVHITLPMDTEIFCNENKNLLGIFNRSFETFEMLKNFAKEIKTDVKITKCENKKRFQSAELNFMEENLFCKNPKVFSGENKNFKIISAVNKRVEVEAVAEKILEIHHSKNFRFKDIGIILRDESYNNLLKNIFEIHKIPFFIDSKRPAIHHPFAELIRSTLEIFRTWRAEPIFRTLRTGFFKIPAEKIDLLENYVIEFGIRGEKNFTQENDWTKHRHKLEKKADEDFNEKEKMRVAEVNEIRREIFSPIIKFSKAVKKKKTVREFVTALYNFFEDLNVYEKLAEMSEFEENQGNLALSKENLKIWDDVINLLEQTEENLSEDIIDAKEFELILNEGLDALEMSIIPPGIDEVSISKFDQNSLQNSRAIFVLGFNDSSFPKKADEKYLLSDVDRYHLKEDYHLEISLGGQENLYAEKFLTYRGLTEAKNFLQISYSLADSEGKAMKESELIKKLKKIFSINDVEIVTTDILNNLGSNIELIPKEKTLSKETAKKLFAPNKKISVSVSKIEDFNGCPFKFFANYGLNLKEREEYKIQVPDIGNILHYVMKKFGEDLAAEKKMWRDIDDKNLNERVTKIVDDLTGNIKNKILLSNNSYKHRRDRIKKVAITSLKRLIELDKVSKFHPKLFEKNFNKVLTYKIDDAEVELTGVIDRIDFENFGESKEEGKYFLIIDYKTGEAYLDLVEMFEGVNLQLITYLSAAQKINPEKNYAAMLYYFLKYPSESGDDLETSENKINKNLKMDGWILADENIVLKIDESLNFIRVAFKKDGGFKMNESKNHVQDEKIFSAMIKKVDEILKETCERILGGDISADPFQSKKKDACSYCNYSELCGFNPNFDKARTPEFSEEKILEKLRGEK